MKLHEFKSEPQNIESASGGKPWVDSIHGRTDHLWSGP
jgi:hypothetical protein